MECRKVTIRGLKDDCAVLCTSTETYSMRQVQTSNTMLLLRSADTPADGTMSKAFLSTNQSDGRVPRCSEMLCSFSAYLELTKISPGCDRLSMMLGEAPFDGPDEESRIRDWKLYSFSDLQLAIQASDAQLTDALMTLNAFEWQGFVSLSHFVSRLLVNRSFLKKGYWRIASDSYIQSIIELILITAIEEDMPLTSMRLSILVQSLESHGVPELIIDHCLGVFADSSEYVDGDRVFKLSYNRLGRFYGEQLLKTVPATGISLNEFMAKWKDLNPDVVPTNLDYIKVKSIPPTPLYVYLLIHTCCLNNRDCI